MWVFWVPAFTDSHWGGDFGVSGWGMIQPLVQVVHQPPDDPMADWLLASFGADDDGVQWFVTTKHVRASEYGDLWDFINPQAMAEMLVDVMDRRIQDTLQHKLPFEVSP